MALITCPECGREISDKAAVCPHCGNPMQVTQQPAVSSAQDEFEKYMLLARRAKTEGNSENAAKYYDLALQKNPNSWEASFYQVYYAALQCTYAEVSNAATRVANSIPTTMVLLHDQVSPDEYPQMLRMIITDCKEIIGLFNSGIDELHLVSLRASNGDTDYVNRIADDWRRGIASIERIHMQCLSSLTQYFSEKGAIITEEAKEYAVFLYVHQSVYLRTYVKEKMEVLEEIIHKTDPAYVMPQIKEAESSTSGGCFVATCVYGSYDCPQVWTLRRFRDDTLAGTWYGRAFIHTYYAISPTIVKWFGKTEWFKQMWRGTLDRMVDDLNRKGVEDTPYQDRPW